MSEPTPQTKTWTGDFGRLYTDRNPQNSQALNELYMEMYGVKRTELNEQFVGGMDRTMRILEVGSNVGSQLMMLQELGFENLYGVELQWYAVEQSRKQTKGLNLIQGSAFELPFRDGFFDLVFTSGVLIHISPSDVPKAMGEIYRCSRRWIWGFEYYADTWTEIPYRGHTSLMWKGDYAGCYMKHHPDLSMVMKRDVEYAKERNVDQMFLLEKSASR